MHTLIVEPEATAESLGRTLERHGHEVRIAPTGERARSLFRWADLILLELELPDVDGVRICREIRAERDAAVIITSNRSAEVDKVLGLQAGSDDYIVKPFGVRELLARIDAVMRRVRQAPELPRPMVHGPLRIDPVRYEVYVGTRRVHVTRKEFKLLHLLASAPDTVLSREQIMSDVWEDNWTASRTIDTHVSMLRRKLGSGDWIVTVRGVGFRLGSVNGPTPLHKERGRLALLDTGYSGSEVSTGVS